jgi:hypothetical protein
MTISLLLYLDRHHRKLLRAQCLAPLPGLWGNALINFQRCLMMALTALTTLVVITVQNRIGILTVPNSMWYS